MPILAFALFCIADSCIGYLPFSAFGQREWFRFTLFIAAEIVILAILIVSLYKIVKISNKRSEQILEHHRNIMADAAKKAEPCEYDYVWLDFGEDMRALVKKKGMFYHLTVQVYDEHTDDWRALGSLSLYNSLEEVKRTLFFDYNFHSDQNTVQDMYGNEIFRP